MKSARNEPGGRAAFWRGLAVWAAVGVLGIYLRGIRWEETWERAQALTGMIPYPEGHPLLQYARGAIGFHYYLTALVMGFTENPAIICGARDVLSAWSAILPVYLLGCVLGKRVAAGHLAALLCVAEIHLFFCSYYGLQVWPDKFTAGTIGQGWALLIIAALSAARWRTAFALLGFMPIIHLGHMPIVLGVGLLALAWRWRAQPESRRDNLIAFGIPLACALCFVLLIRWNSGPIPSAGPYFSDADALDAWRRFTHYEDIHRAPTATPRFGDFANSLMVLGGLLLLSTALVRRDWVRARQAGPWMWILLYALGCALAVGTAKAAQTVLGEYTPYLLIGWLPYRSPNLCAILLIPLVVAVLRPRAEKRFNLALLIAAALGFRVILEPLLPQALVARFLTVPEAALFFLVGASAIRLWREMGHGAFRTIWGACTVAGIGLLALEHQFGAALVVSGAVTGWLLEQPRATMNVPWRRAYLAVTAIGIALLASHTALQLRRTYLPALKVNPFDQQLAEVLHRELQPGELLLTPHWHLDWQEKLNCPVFLTFETPYFLPYMRRLAPVIEQMLTDAYGIRFGESWDYELHAWRERDEEAWRALGEKYGIRFVLAPANLTLALEPVLRGESLVLYRIKG